MFQVLLERVATSRRWMLHFSWDYTC